MMRSILRTLCRGAELTCWRRNLSVEAGLGIKQRVALLQAPGPSQRLQLHPLQNQTHTLQPHQVKIQVEYCSLNSTDVKHMEGDKHPFPFIPGYELSGEILKVGEDVSDFNSGERVVALATNRSGGLASQIILDVRDVWKLPSEISTHDAAALVCGHATALLAFTKYRQLKEGDTILIIAGAGGFGLAAVDIAASIFKAKVIALADTEGKASLLRDRGAFAAFSNDLKHNKKEIMDATKNKGVDLIYDAVGGLILNTVIKCLKDPEEGTILTTYRKDELENPIELEDDDTDSKKSHKADKKMKIDEEVMAKIKTVSLTDFRNEDYEDYYNLIEQTLQFCEDGLISAHVSQNFNLEQINEAIDFIKGKMCTGKVLIKI